MTTTNTFHISSRVKWWNFCIFFAKLSLEASVTIRQNELGEAALFMEARNGSSTFTFVSQNENFTFSLYHQENKLLTLLRNEDPMMVFQKDVRVMNLNLGNMLNNDFMLVGLDTFDNGADGWSDARISTCGISSDIFLGGHCKFSYHSPSKTFRDIPDHSQIRVEGRIHFIDAWEGDSIALMLDDAYANAYSHNWCPSIFQSRCHQYSINECGSSEGDKLSQFFSVQIAHGKSEIVSRKSLSATYLYTAEDRIQTYIDRIGGPVSGVLGH